MPGFECTAATTMTAETAASVMVRTPAPRTVAADMARAMTTASCTGPVPMTLARTSPRAMPIDTPTNSSTARRRRWATSPMAMMAAIGANARRPVPQKPSGHEPRQAGGQCGLGDGPGLVPQTQHAPVGARRKRIGGTRGERVQRLRHRDRVGAEESHQSRLLPRRS